MENTRLITLAENAKRKDFLPSEIDAIRRALAPIEAVAAAARRLPRGATLDLAVDALGRIGRVLLQVRRCVAGRERWIRTVHLSGRRLIRTGGQVVVRLARQRNRSRSIRLDPAAPQGLPEIARSRC